MLFLHIPKTGGISLRHTLLELCGELPVYRILHPIDDHARLVAMAAEERRRFALVEGHMYYGVHARIPRPSTYVTILREPVARVLSFYRYVSRHDWHHLNNDITSKGMTLEDCYASALTVELDNFMTRALSSLDYVARAVR